MEHEIFLADKIKNFSPPPLASRYQGTWLDAPEICASATVSARLSACS